MLNYNIDTSKYVLENDGYMKFTPSQKDYMEEAKKEIDKKVELWNKAKNRYTTDDIAPRYYDDSEIAPEGWEWSDIFKDYVKSTYSGSSTSVFVNKLLEAAKKWLGTPYVYGGSTKGGIDCSNFVSKAAKEAGYNISAGTINQWDTLLKEGKTFSDASQLKPGDLIYFLGTQKKRKWGLPSHVAIYVGNGLFIGSLSSKGVSYDSLNSDYWLKHLLGYARLS